MRKGAETTYNYVLLDGYPDTFQIARIHVPAAIGILSGQGGGAQDCGRTNLRSGDRGSQSLTRLDELPEISTRA